MLARLWGDLRHGLRSLRARPGFALAAVLTLALGIGANTLVFTLIDGVYLRALPYRAADRLVDVYASSAKFGGGPDNVSIPDYVDLQAGVPALAASALYADASFNLVAAGGAPERLPALRATPSLFATLGVDAALGRVFNADDAAAGRDHVAVLSDAVWRNRFGADAQVLERSLRLDGADYRVIGVLPPGFMFPRSDVGVFVPFGFAPADLAEDRRGYNFSSIVGRLAPQATAAQVEAQCAAVVARNIERLGTSAAAPGAAWAREAASDRFRFGVRPLREALTGRNAGDLVMLQVAVALVLLIAIANAGNLLLVRLSTRRAELGLRTALGARPRDLARQLGVESGLLAAAGGMLGLTLSLLGARIVARSGLLPAWAHFALDVRTCAFALGATAFASVAFGLAPVLISMRAAPQAALRETARLAGGGTGARRVRATLVIVQIALALALLAGAGLLLRSFANAAAQSPGFVSDHVLTARLALPAARYADDAARARALRRIVDAVNALPGVDSAGATTRLPFGGGNAGLFFQVEGRPNTESPPHAAVRSVDENYFRTLQIPVVRGRAFSADDWDAQAKTVVVDAAFADSYFPGADPIGQRITLGMDAGGEAYTIIGVVGKVKHFDLTLPAAKPTYYFNLGTRASDSVFLALRSASASGALVDALRAAVRSVDPEQPLFDIRMLDQRIEDSLTGRRVPLQLIALFAGAALLLAAVGVYAVLAFAVEQRTGEIGLRMAIGANSRRVRLGILGDGVRLIGAGVGAGLLAALATGWLLRGHLFGVAPFDPGSIAGVALVLVATALAACWLPARRAARLDPIVALRHE